MIIFRQIFKRKNSGLSESFGLKILKNCSKVTLPLPSPVDPDSICSWFDDRLLWMITIDYDRLCIRIHRWQKNILSYYIYYCSMTINIPKMRKCWDGTLPNLILDIICRSLNALKIHICGRSKTFQYREVNKVLYNTYLLWCLTVTCGLTSAPLYQVIPASCDQCSAKAFAAHCL